MFHIVDCRYTVSMATSPRYENGEYAVLYRALFLRPIELLFECADWACLVESATLGLQYTVDVWVHRSWHIFLTMATMLLSPNELTGAKNFYFDAFTIHKWNISIWSLLHVPLTMTSFGPFFTNAQIRLLSNGAGKLSVRQPPDRWIECRNIHLTTQRTNEK